MTEDVASVQTVKPSEAFELLNQFSTSLQGKNARRAPTSLACSYRCAEDAVAALQLPGGGGRLLAEAQLAVGPGPWLGALSPGLQGPRVRSRIFPA